jgi:hypothetical protein
MAVYIHSKHNIENEDDIIKAIEVFGEGITYDNGKNDSDDICEGWSWQRESVSVGDADIYYVLYDHDECEVHNVRCE